MQDNSAAVIELISSSDHLSLIASSFDGKDCVTIGIPDINDNGETIIIPLAIVLNDEIMQKLKITAGQ